MQPFDEMAENLGRDQRPAFTGRSIVIFREDATRDEAAMASRMESVLKDRAGAAAVASTMDFRLETFSASQAETADAITLPRLGMAVMPTPMAEAAFAPQAIVTPDGLLAVPMIDGEVEAVIPEKYDYLMADDAGMNFSYTRGGQPAMPMDDLDFRVDPVAIRRLEKMLRLLSQVSEALTEPQPAYEQRVRLGSYEDTAAATWGLQATGVLTSRYSGRGVRVAVIDTGFDLAHRDFAGRRVVRQLFAPPGTGLEPTNTHGTHCVGTACGPRTPVSGAPRYGVAYDTEIYALKVFDDGARPSARRGDVLTAMDFANRAGCRVLSLSLGSASNGAVDTEYARAITRLRRAGSLTVAAAGNEGRYGYQVGSPASSPDAMAVAAVDQNLRRADFSNQGAALDIAAPGVRVVSSVIGGGTRPLDGTSMATPHVAGIAALWLEANPAWTPDQLEAGMKRAARRLPQSANDVGVGLVQAPQ